MNVSNDDRCFTSAFCRVIKTFFDGCHAKLDGHLIRYGNQTKRKRVIENFRSLVCSFMMRVSYTITEKT